MASLAVVLGLSVRFGRETASVLGIPYLVLVPMTPVVWVFTLALVHSYDHRFLSSGAEMFMRVYRGGLTALAWAAVLSFLLHANLSRGFVAIAFPAMTLGTLVTRYFLRKAIHRRLASGSAVHRVLVLGSRHEVESLVHHVGKAAHAGYAVVATCVLGNHTGPEDRLHPELRDLDVVLGRLNVDTIAVAGVSTLPPGELRRLAWSLEGENIDLIVDPGVTDFAGPRIVVRPVDGLPLLHIDEPDVAGVRREAKHLVERFLAALMLLFFSPVLLWAALAIKRHDGGPVLFRQHRVGLHGQRFKMLKFRTMTADAELLMESILDLNEYEDVLFKVRDDPRVTRVGRFLRRHSLDELPQLLNVIRGEMSLVGPRPPLESEVAKFGSDARRRLLVRPGMTGLWQISGRSDLPWAESVRLDLHYVENWTLALDMMVLWKTLGVVIHGRGAY
ncbi:MAG: sugar transferase [Candidatus Dormibacteraeota bacterium]|nr:sugar transferase [Candidatus Dormibacteraeota bacterium]